MSTYSPLEDRILVRTVKKESQTTDGGIFIPETAKKHVSEGMVIEAGHGRYAPETGVLIPCFLSKGDNVLYGTEQGMDIEIDSDNGKETVRLLRESDVLLLIRKKTAT